jgi:hypothetical protein
MTSSATMSPYSAHDKELKKDIKLGLNGRDAVDFSLKTFPNVANGAPIRSMVATHPKYPISSNWSEQARPVTRRQLPTSAQYTNLFEVGDIAS